MPRAACLQNVHTARKYSSCPTSPMMVSSSSTCDSSCAKRSDNADAIPAQPACRNCAGVELSGGAKAGNCGLPKEIQSNNGPPTPRSERQMVGTLIRAGCLPAACLCIAQASAGRSTTGTSETVHFARRAMEITSQPLGRMFLTQQRARADALHNVILPAVETSA